MGRSATLLTDPHSMAVANKLGHEALRPFNGLPGASVSQPTRKICFISLLGHSKPPTTETFQHAGDMLE